MEDNELQLLQIAKELLYLTLWGPHKAECEHYDKDVCDCPYDSCWYQKELERLEKEIHDERGCV